MQLIFLDSSNEKKTKVKKRVSKSSMSKQNIYINAAISSFISAYGRFIVKQAENIRSGLFHNLFNLYVVVFPQNNLFSLTNC